jgi:hypothetical protein
MLEYFTFSVILLKIPCFSWILEGQWRMQIQKEVN